MGVTREACALHKDQFPANPDAVKASQVVRTLEAVDPKGAWHRPCPEGARYLVSQPTDIVAFRTAQAELFAELDAQSETRRHAAQNARQIHNERASHTRLCARITSENSAAKIRRPFNPYCDAPSQFDDPIIDTSPSRKYIKNTFLSGFLDGLEGEKPPHHQPNTRESWNYCTRNESGAPANDVFGPVPTHRRTVKETCYAELAKKNHNAAMRAHCAEALRATCGRMRREDMLEKAEPFSVLKGDCSPWVLQRATTHTTFSEKTPISSGEPYIDKTVREHVDQCERTSNPGLQIITGKTTASSKWHPPKRPLHGTTVRKDEAKALLKLPSRPPCAPRTRPASAVEATDNSQPSDVIQQPLRPQSAPVHAGRLQSQGSMRLAKDIQQSAVSGHAQGVSDELSEHQKRQQARRKSLEVRKWKKVCAEHMELDSQMAAIKRKSLGIQKVQEITSCPPERAQSAGRRHSGGSADARRHSRGRPQSAAGRISGTIVRSTSRKELEEFIHPIHEDL